MATGWFFTKNGIDVGPMSLADLIDLAAIRRIEPDTIVWSTTNPSKVPAATVYGLVFGARQAKRASGGKLVAMTNRTSVVAMLIFIAWTVICGLVLSWRVYGYYFIPAAPIDPQLDEFFAEQGYIIFLSTIVAIAISWLGIAVPAGIVWFICRKQQ